MPVTEEAVARAYDRACLTYGYMLHSWDSLNQYQQEVLVEMARELAATSAGAPKTDSAGVP